MDRWVRMEKVRPTLTAFSREPYPSMLASYATTHDDWALGCALRSKVVAVVKARGPLSPAELRQELRLAAQTPENAAVFGIAVGAPGLRYDAATNRWEYVEPPPGPPPAPDAPPA